VAIEPGIYGEGSVSALLLFSSSMRGKIGPPAGLLKVLKPFIAGTFHDDIAQLAQLADYFDANQERYNLGKLNLRAMLNEVRSLYEAEVDFVHERENLTVANALYSRVPGIRIPQPIEALSTNRVTAMSEERGVKITDAFPGDLLRRRQLARTLVECLVARPLFSTEEVAMFHADPHAGNLRVNEGTGEIVLLDWALTAHLTVPDRRSMILLMLAFPLRDEGQMLAALSEISELKDEANRRFLKQCIEAFMDTLPIGSIPRSGKLGNLVNDLLRAGGRFSGSFLIFRKTLATLGDIVEEIAPGESIERIVLEYAWRNGLLDAFNPTASKSEFRLPLRASDVFQIGLSAQSFLPRMWAQSLRGIARNIGNSNSESKQSLERH
jgi:predicted unusual protein kinase regulating ubiquinone biosynthesis (AarF/ABC1/UbiB family)